jgi:hypothetical protein
MATRIRSGQKRARPGGDLGPTITAFLRDAAAGRALDPAGKPYTPAGLRSLQRALVPVEAQATSAELATADASGAGGLERLGRRIAGDAGLPPARAGLIVAALRGLTEYQLEQLEQRAAVVDPPPLPSPTAASDAAVSSPTHAMLELGAKVGAWTERIILVAFVLAVIGLALELL